MAREQMLWIAIVIVLLTTGLLLGRQFSSLPDDASITSFRQWFWDHRSLDLAVQVGLIFVSTLGIAALLPRNKENE